MAPLKNKPPIETVDAFILQLPDPFKEMIEATRRIILDTDKEVGEQIKWNAPCFVYTGDMKPFNPKEYKRDIAVLNVYKDYVLLVFPTGATIKDNSGILEGSYTDGRRLVKIYDMKDLLLKEKPLKHVIKEWLKLVEK
ncbi:MAG: DUF1801 domain-containing protein [Chitinophagaceae bacterium]